MANRLKGQGVKRFNPLTFYPFILFTYLPFYLLSFSPHLFAESLQQMDKEIKGQRKELDQIKKKISNLESERKKLQQEELALQRSLSQLDREIIRSVKRQVELQKKVRLMESQLAKTKKMVHAFREDQKMWEEMVLADLRVYHVRFSHPQSLRGDPLKKRVAAQQALWKFLNMKDADRQKRFYQERETSYTISMVRLESAKEELKAEIAKQRKAQQEKNKLYQTTLGKRLIAERQVRELQETADSLERMILELARKKQKTLAELREAEIAKKSMDEKRGLLPWPIEGRVISSFGKQLHPELKVSVLNNGIKIKTEPKSMVKSIEAGTVIYASDFRSYGQTVIVEHSGDYFSIYGLLGSIAVKEGQNLGAGEAVGTTLPGPDSELYFEWRVGGRAEDPLLWLR